MATRDNYRRWLASGETTREVLETFEVNHPAFGSSFIVNGDRDFRALKENGDYQVFRAGRFYAEPPETNPDLEQAMTVAFAAGDGAIYETIQKMTPENRLTPITATYRIYFSDEVDWGPRITPPPTWYVHSIEATREAIKADLRAPHMRIQRVGLYYTAHEFPVLRLL